MSEPPAPAAPKKRKIYVALATYANNIRAETHQCLVAMYSAALRDMFPDVEFQEGCIGGDGVSRARNWLAQDFLLNTDCDSFLPIDVDIGWRPEHIKRLIAAEVDICGALYACKQMNHRWIMTELPDAPFVESKGVQKVYECGTGMVLIKRKVFEGMIQAFPEIAYLCDNPSSRGRVKWDFFSMGVVEGRYLSEDYYFCHRARKIGFDIHVDGLCQVVHHGGIGFPFTSNLKVFDDMTIDQVHELAVGKGNIEHRNKDDLTRIAV